MSQFGNVSPWSKVKYMKIAEKKQHQHRNKDFVSGFSNNISHIYTQTYTYQYILVLKWYYVLNCSEAEKKSGFSRNVGFFQNGIWVYLFNFLKFVFEWLYQINSTGTFTTAEKWTGWIFSYVMESVSIVEWFF